MIALLIAEDKRRAGMPRAERAAGAVCERDFAILDLARTALAAQLLGRFDHQEDSAHPRMVRRQAAAVGVDWKITVVAEPPAGYERAAFAAFAEAEILERRENGDRERIVDHCYVDVFVRDASALERKPSRLRRRNFQKIPLASRRVTDRLARAENIDRLLLQIPRALGRGDHQRAAAIADDATIEQMQRRRDDSRRKHISDRDRLAILRDRIHRRMQTHR